MAFVSVFWCVCVSMRGCVCVSIYVCALYLMTNRIEGSEQSGLNDYYGNKGDGLGERGGMKTKSDYTIN